MTYSRPFLSFAESLPESGLTPVSDLADHGQNPPEAVLPGPIEAELEQLAKTLRWHLEQTSANIIESGRLLIQAKRMLRHGRFRLWLRENISMSAKTANRLMAVAQAVERLQADSATQRQLLSLDLRTLYRLTAKTTPQQVQLLVFRQLAQHQSLDYSSLQTLIQAERQQTSHPAAAKRNLAVLTYRLERFTDWVASHQSALKPAYSIDSELHSELSACADKLRAAGTLLDQILQAADSCLLPLTSSATEATLSAEPVLPSPKQNPRS